MRFPRSEILSWKDNGDKKEAGVFKVGRLGKADLERARTDYNDPFYRLELLLEPETLSALRNLLESGPLTGADDINYPFLGRTAIFSTKLKTLQKSDAKNLEADDIFDGRDMPDTDLVDFPAGQLSGVRRGNTHLHLCHPRQGSLFGSYWLLNGATCDICRV